jgi:hypothetical protein
VGYLQQTVNLAFALFFALFQTDLKKEEIGRIRTKASRLRKKGVQVVRNILFCEGKQVVGQHEIELRKKIIQGAHEATAHGGSNATFSKVRDGYYGISEVHCQEFLKGCEKCARYNTKALGKTEMTTIEVESPWEHIEVDLIDVKFFKSFNDDYAWILTCVDHFSRYEQDCNAHDWMQNLLPVHFLIPSTFS